MRAKSVTLENVTKEFVDAEGNKMRAVDNVSLQIKEGQFITLLGPSGCGKTTTLRMIAGFEELSQGNLFFGDENVVHIPANKRDCTMVFQSYALFPHMTVYENICYGLKLKKLAMPEIEKRVAPVMDIMNLHVNANRMPNQLSGGQQQRVALARALVMEPGVLLFDEPLSNLDAKLRVTMRDEISRVQRELGITAIYVTHDQSEAMSLSDQIVVMNAGKIEQVGTPLEIYQQPKSRFVSDFIGTANFLEGKVVQVSKEKLTVRTNGSTLDVSQANAGSFKEGQQIAVVIRPEAIVLDGKEGKKATVTKSVFMGAIQEYEIDYSGVPLYAIVADPGGKRIYATGDEVAVHFSSRSLHVVPA
ncbi:ABC transporter ATP-binding protein [Shouchella clausii]|uniref:ABC transporter ATP-binding protein n=1 Tax=Shouchella clausii TaxID=79880 RepID=UPI000BA56013|nr:ABC transporter ATP-binding protein [Shouchella clausii]MDO7283816.1 ABC transporter ATP-binding protein [Shouchella clausii]MDO7303912.1 ABC transporter ATP-binding protein [Shouchella clausii]MEB5479212.1 ABC transporter ATP-binding protein [Shouchella clausii]MED4158725.1 ABC transporter ATP-binding protein [Shouchella clausii]MED4176478.1 ABC transporter ATP-binding protein [Shouchella clausii]